MARSKLRMEDDLCVTKMETSIHFRLEQVSEQIVLPKLCVKVAPQYTLKKIIGVKKLTQKRSIHVGYLGYVLEEKMKRLYKENAPRDMKAECVLYAKINIADLESMSVTSV